MDVKSGCWYSEKPNRCHLQTEVSRIVLGVSWLILDNPVFFQLMEAIGHCHSQNFKICYQRLLANDCTMSLTELLMTRAPVIGIKYQPELTGMVDRHWYVCVHVCGTYVYMQKYSVISLT